MKGDESRKIVYDQPISQDDDEFAAEEIVATDDVVANDDAYKPDLEMYSADFYERRVGMWSKINQGDFWIAAVLYLILASVAYVAL